MTDDGFGMVYHYERQSKFDLQEFKTNGTSKFWRSYNQWGGRHHFRAKGGEAAWGGDAE